MEAYCVKCKVKREILEPKAVFTETGTPATKGVCPVCGTNLFRMGRTEAHNGLKPEKVRAREKNKRAGKLVIVESPAKARTVGRFLGKGYTVKASIGHVRDLLKSQISVDVENDFTPKYRVLKEKRAVVKEIKELAGKVEEVYLATDPDREGEAIAWHLMEASDIDPTISHRVVFHEITEPAVAEAFAHPREINSDLVDAQQARRVLDRLVGYNLSPLLWRKVRGRLSAGRVQSVALRLVVEREKEIDAFIPIEYWTISAEFIPDGGKESYIARLVKLDGEDPEFGAENDVTPVVEDMRGADFKIEKIKKGERKRSPLPPFITSTLQQEGSRRLGLTTRRTMALAQQLYEGIDVGNGGTVGLITYMRTDSTNVSELARKEVQQFISSRYGEKYLPSTVRNFTTQARGAQEAHEAIRPTSVMRLPNAIKKYLTNDQYRLYKLIWQRFVASQMASAIFNTISVEVNGITPSHHYLLRASGSTLRFRGFMAVYEESKDEDQRSEEEQETRIPSGLEEDQVQKLVQILPEQHYTQPPPRFTEASLVKTLEENGIGRPSTYAPILSTLQQRGYVTRDKKRLIPTETGCVVNDLITEHFPDIVDIGFTVRMEDDLDKIATGEEDWVEIVRTFYDPFAKQVARADQLMPEMKVEPEPIGRQCPNCGHDLVIRWGRYGKFISCSNFPKCRHTEPWLEKLGIPCPQDGGDIVERKTRRGRVFYGCANYPECDFTSWKRPIKKPCPNCGGLLVEVDKRSAACLNCEEQYSLQDITSEEITEAA